MPPVTAPPPLSFVPRNERSQLQSTTNPKNRVRLSLDLANSRLRRAEELMASQYYLSATAELGIYQGIIQDTIQFLRKLEGRKHRDLYKRLEISLREHGSRIEYLRRLAPAEFAGNFRSIYEFTRQTRTEGLNLFFGKTVLRHTNQPDESGHNITSRDDKPDPQ